MNKIDQQRSRKPSKNFSLSKYIKYTMCYQWLFISYPLFEQKLDLEKNDEKRNIGREQGYEAYDI